MVRFKLVGVTSTMLLFGALLSGCAVQDGAGKSRTPGGDAAITTDVEALVREHRDLGPPNELYITTHHRVVYLSGVVATPLQRESAEELASGVPGVRAVVNSVSVTQ